MDRISDGITFMWLLNECDVLVGDLSDWFADTSGWLVRARVSWSTLVAEASLKTGWADAARDLSLVVEVAVGGSWAWAWCTIVWCSLGRISIISLLASLAMSSLRAVLAKKTSSKVITSSWRVIIAVAWSTSGLWLTIVWSSTTSVSNESWLTSLALISFGVVLTVQTVSVFLVTLACVSVAFALLAESKVEASSGS